MEQYEKLCINCSIWTLLSNLFIHFYANFFFYIYVFIHWFILKIQTKGRSSIQSLPDEFSFCFQEDLDVADKKIILDSDLARFFYSGAVPFLKVENSYFLRFISNLGKFNIPYKPPDRKVLASNFVQRIRNEIIESKRKILSGTEGVLLVDGWRNKNANKKYLVFSIKNANIHLAYLTYFDTSIETEDGKTLSTHINEAIELAKNTYDCYIYAILSDNDSKILKGGDLAETCDGRKLIQSSCNSHSGNLLIKCFVDQDLTSIFREVVTAFREPKLEALLKRAGGTRLQNFPDTRFCYLRDSCASILTNLQKLRALSDVTDLNLSERVKDRLRSEDFQILLRSVIDNLDPICELINACQGPKVNIADATEMWLTLRLPSNEYDQQISARISKALRAVNFSANLLHHRYNGENLNEEQREKAENFLATYFSEQAQHEFVVYNSTRREFEKLARNCQDPVDYWKIVRMSLPALATEAIRLQLIPASTASLEGLFSEWTFVHSCYRNRLGDDKSAELLDIYHSLKSAYFSGDVIQGLIDMDKDGENIRW